MDVTEGRSGGLDGVEDDTEMLPDDLPASGFIRASLDFKHAVCQAGETASGIRIDAALRKQNMPNKENKGKMSSQIIRLLFNVLDRPF